MRKRKFFITSLPLAVAALVAQVAVFYLILLAASQMEMRVLFPFGAPPRPEPASDYGQIPLIVLLTGLGLAISSVACVTLSFRRREPGWAWRLIPITLLTVYLGSWLVLFCSS